MFRQKHWNPTAPTHLIALRDVGQLAPAPFRFRMTDNVHGFGQEFFVLNDLGERVFRLDGRAIRSRDIVSITDLDGPTSSAKSACV